jgi:hypothetical protein
MPGKQRKSAARPRKGERRARADSPATIQTVTPHPTQAGRKRRREERTTAHHGSSATDLLVQSLVMTGIADKLLARVLALAQESGLNTEQNKSARKRA